MVGVGLILSKREAIRTLFPCAIFRAWGWKGELLVTTLRASRASTLSTAFIWGHVPPYLAAMFSESNPPHLDQVIRLVVYVLGRGVAGYWYGCSIDRDRLEDPYTDGVGQSVTDALL